MRRGLLEKAKWQELNAEAKEINDFLNEQISALAEQWVNLHTNNEESDEWNIKELAESVSSLTGKGVQLYQDSYQEIASASSADPEKARERLAEAINKDLVARLQEKETDLGEEFFKNLAKTVAIRSIDMHWMDHLDNMDYLRTGIGLRGYGQRDPLVEYQKEGYRMFKDLLQAIKGTIVEAVFKAQAVRSVQEEGKAYHESVSAPHRIGVDVETGQAGKQGADDKNGGTEINPNKNVGRNDPCPCGSGKKFKKCHGA